MCAAGDESRDVRDVRNQYGADLVGDRGERREVDSAGDRRAAADDELRTLATGEVANLVHVDPAGVATYAVPDRTEPLAGDGHAPPVGEVATVRQRHAHDGVAGLAERRVDGEVRRRSGVGLDVCMVDAENRLRTLDGERLDLVNDLLTFVVALADVALGVLVGEFAAGRLEHRAGNIVLRRDQPDLALLTLARGGMKTDDGGQSFLGCLKQVYPRDRLAGQQIFHRGDGHDAHLAQRLGEGHAQRQRDARQLQPQLGREGEIDRRPLPALDPRPWFAGCGCRRRR